MKKYWKKEKVKRYGAGTDRFCAGNTIDYSARFSLGRVMDNAEDVATARQVLTDIVQWFKDGTVCPVKREPFNDKWLNDMVQYIWHEMAGVR